MKLSTICVCALFSIHALITTASADLLSASNAFLKTLDETQTARAVLPFDSEERLNWHFIPKNRIGLNLKELNDEQDELLLNIVRAGLSEDGFNKAEGIRGLEAVLFEIEGAAHRDTELYHILFFGTPSEDGDWTVRYEGHHLSLHWTFVNGKRVATSPQFMGTNPAEVRIEGPKKGLRVLADEEDLARTLVTSLTPKQQKTAILNAKVPRDIFTAASQKAERQDDVGIAYTHLTTQQQGVLMSLIKTLAHVQNKSAAKSRLKEVRKAGLDSIKFAWIGETKKGAPHYYRVQGATFLIEYDNIQNDANHIHVVWRDFDGDFGVDMLKQHHARHAHPDHPGEHKH